MKSNKHSYSPFWTALVLTLVGLACIFGIYFLLLNSRSQSASAEQQNVAVSSYSPDPANSKNILLIGCPDRTQPAEFFILIRFDVVENRCYVIPIPPQVESTVNVKTMSVAQHYEYGSNRYAVSAVENLFLIQIPYYIRIDSDAFTRLVDHYGGLETSLPSAVESEHYQLKEGHQLLDGARVSEVMMLGDTELNAQFLVTFFNQNFTQNNWQTKDSFFNLIFNETDTNLTTLDIRRNHMPLQEFFLQSEERAESLALQGEYYEEGNGFDPEQQSIEKIAKLCS